MICVSIAQSSHRMAFVDILNANALCDLIELRIDKFDKAPDLKALLEVCSKPVLVACRRKQDAGDWQQPEAARLALLRQAVLDKVDYVEIELDCADQIRRYGPTKRVIAYTNISGVPDNLSEIYEEACKKDPDVIKLSMPTRGPEEVYPLLKIIAKSQIPTVAVGWGRNGVMLNIMGKKYGSPWSCAALEKGMEAFPGMATISELESIYDYRAIDAKTPLLGIAGFTPDKLLMTRVLNHGFRLAGNKTRCVPMEMGNIELFRKVASATRLAGVLVDERHREEILKILTDKEDSVEIAKACDFVYIKGDKWQGFNSIFRGVRRCLEDAITKKHGGSDPLAGRSFLIVGCSGTGRSIAHSIRKKGGTIIVADKDENRAKQLAADISARYTPAGLVYTTMCDGVILCPPETGGKPGKAAIEMPKSIVREGLISVDLTNFPFITPFLEETRVLNGVVVKPIDILLKMAEKTLRAYTGQSFTEEQLREPLADFDFESVHHAEE